MTSNGRKIRLSGAKKIKRLFEQIGLGDLWMKAHYGDRGIITRGVNRGMQIRRSVDPPKFLFKSKTTNTSGNRRMKV